MRKLLLLSFAVAVFSARADVINVASRISSVEVYQGQARVTRTFEAALPEGQHTLVFAGLPMSADMNAVQLAVDTNALRLGRVSHDPHFSPADESDLLRDLRVRLEGLETEKASVEQQRKTAEEFAAHHRELLKAIREGIRETGEVALYELSREAWTAGAEAQRKSFEEIQTLEARVRELDREIAEARRLYQERLSQERQSAIKLMVEVQAAGGVSRGTLTYVAANAHWSPVYSVRAGPGSNRTEIIYQASVQQFTGEDWTDVSLTLSTGRPSAGGKPVEPDPIFLRKVDPRVALSVDRMELAPFEVQATAAGKGYSDSARTRTQLVEPPPPVISASTTGFEAALPGVISVASGKPAAVFPMLEQEVETEFWSVTIPLTSEAAFLVGRLKNPFELPLLAGPVQVFVDGRLSGFGQIEETLPGEELELGLGENQNIAVERKVLAEDASRSGLINRSRHEERRYQVSLTNHMPVPQKVVVKDRVPVSRDERIEVEVRSPKGVNIEEDTGLFAWEIVLAPGESTTVLTHFIVTYPHDWEINTGF